MHTYTVYEPIKTLFTTKTLISFFFLSKGGLDFFFFLPQQENTTETREEQRRRNHNQRSLPKDEKGEKLNFERIQWKQPPTSFDWRVIFGKSCAETRQLYTKDVLPTLISSNAVKIWLNLRKQAPHYWLWAVGSIKAQLPRTPQWQRLRLWKGNLSKTFTPRSIRRKHTHSNSHNPPQQTPQHTHTTGSF